MTEHKGVTVVSDDIDYTFVTENLGVEGVTTEDERNVVEEKGFDNSAYATTEVKETNDEEITDTDL